MTDERLDDHPAAAAEQTLSRRTLLKGAAAAGIALSGAGALASASHATARATGTSITFFKGPWVANEPAFVNKIYAPLRSANPPVDVTETQYQWGTRVQDMARAFASSTPPDVTYFSEMFWAQYAAAGALAPLDSYIKQPDFAPIWNSIPKTLQQTATYNGHVYAIPFVIALGSGHLANTKLLKQAGASNWNSSLLALRKAAKQVKDKTGAWGFAMPSTYVDGSWQTICAFIESSNTTIFSPDLSKCTINTPGFVANLNVLRDIYVTDKSAPAPGLYPSSELNSMWLDGKIALFDIYSVQPPQIQGIKFPYTFEAEPGVVPGRYGSYLGNGHLAMSAKSQNADAAWEFIKYTSTAKGLLPWIKALDYFYVGARSNEAGLFNTHDPLQREYKTSYENVALKYGKTFPPSPHISAVSYVLSNELQAMLSGSQTAGQTAKNMEDQINAILA